jgi:hypothetical protein
VGKEIIYYSQHDKRWENDVYSLLDSKSQTIGTSGCGPTTAAMIVAQWKDKTVTPKTLAKFSLQGGYFFFNRLSFSLL